MHTCSTKEDTAAYMAKCAPHRKNYTESDEDDMPGRISAAYLPRLLVLRARLSKPPVVRYLSNGQPVEMVGPFTSPK